MKVISLREHSPPLGYQASEIPLTPTAGRYPSTESMYPPEEFDFLPDTPDLVISTCDMRYGDVPAKASSLNPLNSEAVRAYFATISDKAAAEFGKLSKLAGNGFDIPPSRYLEVELPDPETNGGETHLKIATKRYPEQTHSKLDTRSEAHILASLTAIMGLTSYLSWNIRNGADVFLEHPFYLELLVNEQGGVVVHTPDPTLHKIHNDDGTFTHHVAYTTALLKESADDISDTIGSDSEHTFLLRRLHGRIDTELPPPAKL